MTFSSAFASPFLRPFPSQGAAAAFLPTEISGLKIWYALREPSTQFLDTARTTPVASDADLVAGLTDKSGLNYHGTQATSDYRPAYKINQQNGLSALLGGANDYLNFTSLTLTDFTVFAVCKRSNALQDDRLLSASSANQHMMYLGTGSGNYKVGLRANFSSVDISTSVFTSGAFFILAVTRASGALKAYKNSSDVTSGTPNTSTSVAFVKFFNPFIGNVGELLVWDNALSAPNMTLMWTYLNGLWAVY